jgi:hypothetical protein
MALYRLSAQRGARGLLPHERDELATIKKRLATGWHERRVELAEGGHAYDYEDRLRSEWFADFDRRPANTGDNWRGGEFRVGKLQATAIYLDPPAKGKPGRPKKIPAQGMLQ